MKVNVSQYKMNIYVTQVCHDVLRTGCHNGYKVTETEFCIEMNCLLTLDVILTCINNIFH